MTIFRTDAERNLLLIKGPLPGARNPMIIVRKLATAGKAG